MLGQADYFTGGWTCAFCGAFVTHNTYHACNVQPQYQGTPSSVVMNQDAEIIGKLDKVIELLELIGRRLL